MGSLKGLKLAFLGDGFNMANSLMEGGARTGMHIVIATPPGYEPKPEIVARAQQAAQETGGSIVVLNDPREAATGADVLVTDVDSANYLLAGASADTRQETRQTVKGKA